jgi:NAD(P)-dependent dehydrogenase (short-subunit alcohol dehydrogenase family)
MNVMEMFSLKGKRALVTGGAGLFGRQIVDALVEAGAETFTASRSATSDVVKGFAFDQGDEASINNLLQQVGDVDILVNNAVLRSMKGWDDPIENFEKSLKVNATGVLLMTRIFGERMAARGRGSIINISSIQGIVGPDFSLYEGLGWDIAPDYFVHKGGMIQLTRYAAARLGPRGVRVNCISPGGFFNNQDPRFLERYNARTFLGRMANESDLKGAIVYLASDASAYVTGSNLVIDGGYTAK